MTTTMILGAVLAGGNATRFGSDKALAVLDDRSLLDHALATLAPHSAMLVVVGRDTAPVPTIPDLPVSELGPLGGLAGALAYAIEHGFDAVLTTACDTPTVPAALMAALFDAGAGYAAEAPTVGLWPARLAQPLLTHLLSGERRSVRHWAALAGVEPVGAGITVPNVNTPDDLERLTRRA